MIKLGFAMLAMSGVVVVASKYRYSGYRWPDQVCDALHGMCDSASWVAIAAAFLALACVARSTIRNTDEL